MIDANGERETTTITSKLLFWSTAVWCGAAVMAFELAGARLLMPSYGMGIDVWAAVIGATLGFLAVGYATGGKLADARPSPVTLAVVLLLAAASLVFVRLTGRTGMGLFAGLSSTTAVWCAAAWTLALPLLLLGMVQPMLVRLMMRTAERSGSVVGGLMAAATVGGVLGTWLTALILLPQIGVNTTLLTLAAGTALAAVVVLASVGRWTAACIAATAAAIVCGAAWQWNPAPVNAGKSQVLEQVEGLYGHLEVVQWDGCRAIVCNGIVQTAVPLTFGVMNGTLIRGRDYIELVPYFRPQARTALVIGLGGGLHAQALAGYGIEVRCVEIEPAMVPLAARHCGLTAEVTIGDGRAVLARDRGRYDAIVLDTFLGGTVPEHLYTKEAFQEMADHLSSGGLLAVHLIGHPQHAATGAVARTLAAVFPHVTGVRSGLADEFQHLYLFAGREPVELHPWQRVQLDGHGFTGDELFDVKTQGSPLLTDDRTSLAMLSRDLVAEHRRRSRQYRRRL